MPETGRREQHIDITRRRGYLHLCVSGAVVHGALALTSWPQGDWRPMVGAVVSLGLMLAIMSRRVTVHQMDGLLGWAADFGALFTVWSVAQNQGPFSAQTALIFTIFFVLWFGVLPMRAAVLRTALLYAAILAIGFTRQPVEVVPLLYFGFVALLVGQMTFSGRQIRQELSETARYADLAMTDPLTGLLNRRSLYTELNRHYDQQLRNPVRAAYTTRLGVLLIDIDHFKDVNDRYGHDTGDQVLQHLAGVLRHCARQDDRVARWGGEEFLMVIHNADQDTLEQISRRVLHTLRDTSTRLPRVTLSIGVALSSEANNITGLLRLADRRLYRAKRAGRDQVNMDQLSSNTTLLDGGAGLPKSTH